MLSAATDAQDAGLASFVAATADCTSRERFRELVLSRLSTVVGYDAALFTSLDPGPGAQTAVGWSRDDVEHFARNVKKYLAEWSPFARAVRTRGVPVVDTDVIPAEEAERLGFYRSMVIPRQLVSLLFVFVGLRRAQNAAIVLGRRDTSPAFGPRDVATAASLVPAIALGDNAHARSRVSRAPRLRGSAESVFAESVCRLTQREREIIGYLAMGLRNQDIALACGSSPNTVRNQLRSIFGKAGVSTRTELAHAAIATGFVR